MRTFGSKNGELSSGTFGFLINTCLELVLFEVVKLTNLTS